MGLKKFKPTTPSRRFMIINDFAEITTDKPEKSLLAPLKSNGGRNHHGRITVRHQGGGHKRRYRIIDFKTTQHSENFYFVNWFEDIQSLMYIYMCWKKFGIFPQGFDYLVFNWKENNIFLNSITHATPPADDKMKDFFKGLHQILLEAKIMHRAPKKSYYFPTVEKCRFCDYKSICDKAIKT